MTHETKCTNPGPKPSPSTNPNSTVKQYLDSPNTFLIPFVEYFPYAFVRIVVLSRVGVGVGLGLTLGLLRVWVRVRVKAMFMIEVIAKCYRLC